MGLQAARDRGRVGGRRPKLTAHQRTEAIKMVNSGAKSAGEVARLLRNSEFIVQASHGCFPRPSALVCAKIGLAYYQDRQVDQGMLVFQQGLDARRLRAHRLGISCGNPRHPVVNGPRA
jgi:hypothetical protein